MMDDFFWRLMIGNRFTEDYITMTNATYDYLKAQGNVDNFEVHEKNIVEFTRELNAVKKRINDPLNKQEQEKCLEIKTKSTVMALKKLIAFVKTLTKTDAKKLQNSIKSGDRLVKIVPSEQTSLNMGHPLEEFYGFVLYLKTNHKPQKLFEIYFDFYDQTPKVTLGGEEIVTDYEYQRVARLYKKWLATMPFAEQCNELHHGDDITIILKKLLETKGTTSWGLSWPWVGVNGYNF